MASVVDIKAISYDVCGLVHTVSPGYKVKVITSFICNALFTSIYILHATFISFKIHTVFPDY